MWFVCSLVDADREDRYNSQTILTVKFCRKLCNKCLLIVCNLLREKFFVICALYKTNVPSAISTVYFLLR